MARGGGGGGGERGSSSRRRRRRRRTTTTTTPPKQLQEKKKKQQGQAPAISVLFVVPLRQRSQAQALWITTTTADGRTPAEGSTNTHTHTLPVTACHALGRRQSLGPTAPQHCHTKAGCPHHTTHTNHRFGTVHTSSLSHTTTTTTIQPMLRGWDAEVRTDA